jgi:hypothetical protein
MFAAKVRGRSMEPLIPDGALCLFSSPVEGTRQSKAVLAELRDEIDPETGHRYTVKRYRSEKAASQEHGWEHAAITLEPINPEFPPLRLSPEDADRLNVVAEMVEVLDQPARADGKSGDRRVGVVWHTQGSGKKLGLSVDELAFYDALETNDSAVQVLGDETLRVIARELVEPSAGT